MVAISSTGQHAQSADGSGAAATETASRAIDANYGADESSDVAIRRIAEHGRAMTMLVADGVLPSNEGRGYVLRRIIRRAILAARRAGSERPLAASLVDATIEKMGVAYPALVQELCEIALNGFASAFLPWEERERLLARARREIAAVMHVIRPEEFVFSGTGPIDDTRQARRQHIENHPDGRDQKYRRQRHLNEVRDVG